jgi:hypothetical protein
MARVIFQTCHAENPGAQGRILRALNSLKGHSRCRIDPYVAESSPFVQLAGTIPNELLESMLQQVHEDAVKFGAGPITVLVLTAAQDGVTPTVWTLGDSIGTVVMSPLEVIEDDEDPHDSAFKGQAAESPESLELEQRVARLEQLLIGPEPAEHMAAEAPADQPVEAEQGFFTMANGLVVPLHPPTN